MKTAQELQAEAEEVERMARLVSYRKDKEALLARAAELRRAAERAAADERRN
ncbi:hypothetical protein [Phenylobacterium sp. J367]|uniref:hypothetical protein n=1 Tax=Phenylobacterium sp. J367 TaxID=2898435 RepID=UPI002150DC7C|nr:hypothetical protein [Phenylobacterium sp. J367]MCR5879409.1 hypothetical protein [Phenylobacterium sp. J367]